VSKLKSEIIKFSKKLNITNLSALSLETYQLERKKKELMDFILLHLEENTVL